MSQMSSAVAELLQQQIRSEGSLGILLAELEKEHMEFELVPAIDSQGSMSDASKRCLTDPDAEAPSCQLPLPVRGSKRMVNDEALPAGHWGQTLVEVGKFGKKGLSYHDLAVSSEAEKANYLKWMTHAHDQGSCQVPEGILQDLRG